MKLDYKKLEPVNGNMVVMDDKKDEVTSGGIVIPDSTGDGAVIVGTLYASSPFLLESGELKDPIVKGTKCVYGTHAGAGNVWKDDDGRNCRLIKFNEILAFIHA
jgi:co-chaperonin GroES (HSP10)